MGGREGDGGSCVGSVGGGMVRKVVVGKVVAVVWEGCVGGRVVVFFCWTLLVAAGGKVMIVNTSVCVQIYI